LFHYTTGGGLLGILESRSLWGTHAAYLNDAQETTYGLDNVLRELEAMSSQLKIPKELNDDAIWPPAAKHPVVRWVVTELMIGSVLQLAKDRVTLLRQNAGPFVACLSKEGDQLSQWRGYSGDGGYAIRFDSNALQESVKANQPGTQLKFDHPSLGPAEFGVRHFAKMRYSADPEFIRNGIIAFLQRLLRHACTKTGDNPDFDKDEFNEAGQEIVRQQMAWILGLAVQTKNPGFAEEEEFRILTFSEPEMFHNNAIGLIPRINIGFHPSCVREIVVGPGANLELRKSSIESYRNARPQYSHVEVTASETPFRGT
jgi:hypothetical protein